MYKNVAQNTSVGSVEVVITKFLEQSRAKLIEALAKVDELEGPAEKASVVALDGTANEVEDLEASETPESILLSSVSEEKSRDRTYRTLVTPWLRFLWEAYRTALDILRNNARLEVLYQVKLNRLLLPKASLTDFLLRPYPTKPSPSVSPTRERLSSVVYRKLFDLTSPPPKSTLTNPTLSTSTTPILSSVISTLDSNSSTRLLISNSGRKLSVPLRISMV